jgi:hypothetical protein
VRPVNFEFKHQLVQIQVDSGPDFLKRLAAESKKATTPPLRWRSGPGTSGQIVLMSTSGNTTAVVQADSIRAQTRYSTPDYRAVAGWALRDGYSRERVAFLLDVVEKAGGAPLMLSVASVANYMVPEADRASLRAAVARALPFQQIIGGEPWDFNIRSGRPITEDCFLNVTLSWVQVRAFAVVGQPQGGRPQSLRDWEGQVDEEGLEIRIDLNNKLALFEGRVEWTGEQLLKSLGDAQKLLPAEFTRLDKFISGAIIS